MVHTDILHRAGLLMFMFDMFNAEDGVVVAVAVAVILAAVVDASFIAFRAVLYGSRG